MIGIQFVADASQLEEASLGDGELVVARRSRTAFEPLERYRVSDGETWTQPTISGHRLFIKDDSTLTLWTLN